jgi:hypothetical protein
MSVGDRQFSLYEFFSILLPGIVFLIGLVPFLPRDTGSLNFLALLPLLAAGYVAGRFLHVVAVGVERKLPSVVSHRERFSQEISAMNVKLLLI